MMRMFVLANEIWIQCIEHDGVQQESSCYFGHCT